MTPEEAIVELNKEYWRVPIGAFRREAAIKLGIEALEKILLLRRLELNGQRVEPYTKLPSEEEVK